MWILVAAGAVLLNMASRTQLEFSRLEIQEPLVQEEANTWDELGLTNLHYPMSITLRSLLALSHLGRCSV